MADPITLPSLPHFDGDDDPDIKQFNTRRITRAELRARDIEVARLVLEAAAKVCRDFHATDSLSNYGLVMARMIDEVEVRHHE